MKFSNLVDPNFVIPSLIIPNLVILSGTETSRSEVSVESKDLYALLRITRDSFSGAVRQ